MSRKIVELDVAISDVMEAADLVAQYSGLNESDRFLQAVKATTYRQLADMPGIGSLRDYSRPELQGMRMWHVSKFPRYLIFYLATGTELTVLRVLHGIRDIEAVFAPTEE